MQYTSIVFLSCLSLCVLGLLVFRSRSVDKSKKTRFYMTYAVIGMSAIAEWLAVVLNGAPPYTIHVHIAAKCADYVLSPLAALMFVWQVEEREYVRKGIIAIMLLNAALEMLSSITGWTYFIDSANVYHHGPYHFIYIIIFCVSILYALAVFIRFGRNYSIENRVSLYAIVALLCTGIAAQEIIGGEVRTVSLTLVISSILVLIHYCEFYQIQNNDIINEKNYLLHTDSLTGMASHYAFTEARKKLESASVPDNLIVVAADVNGLKEINDSLGHMAGDELLKGAADCIMKAFGRFGTCYRIGGDEFMAILRTDGENVGTATEALRKSAEEWSGRMVKELNISIGVAMAKDNPGLSLSKLINAADVDMYADKESYYRVYGNDRRTNSKGLNDQQIRRLLQSVMLEQYYKVYYADLKMDKYSTIISDNSVWEQKNTPDLSGCLSSWFAWFADSSLCYEGDRQLIRDFSDPEHIKNIVNAGKGQSVSFRFRRRRSPDETAFFDAELRIVPVSYSDEMLTAVILGRNLTEENYNYSRQLALSKAVSDNMRRESGRRTVMIADDNAFNRSVLSVLLSDEYDIITAESQVAADMLRRNFSTVSAVIFNAEMNNKNAAAFVDAVRADALISHVPLIVATDAKGQKAEELCISLGASDYISVPYNAAIIRHRLNNYIALREKAISLAAVETDELTGLYTRQAFFIHAESLISRNPEERFDIIISDIADFKHINERCGRERADNMLRYWGMVLKSDNIEQMISARYGSDQFVLLFRNTNGMGINPDDILKKFDEDRKNCPIPDCFIRFGVYENVDHGLSGPEICDRALSALRTVKRQYGSGVAVYTQQLQKEQEIAHAIEDNMELSLLNQQYEVYYQPKHSATDGALTGAEALIRWIHPVYGFMSPSDFIPVFEATGFITKADLYVWEHVCADLRKRLESGRKVVPVSVNASRIDLIQPNFLQKILEIMNRYSIPPELLHMEITESMYMGGSDEIIETIRSVQNIGVKIELDDFGSGYSSLGMLNKLPIDIIKLDMSFIRNINEQIPVVKTIITLAHDLGYGTVSEGVETKEQLKTLAELGCDSVQGWYYSKPVPWRQFESYIDRCVIK